MTFLDRIWISICAELHRVINQRDLQRQRAMGNAYRALLERARFLKLGVVVVLAVLLGAASAWAGTVTFAWNPSPTPGVSYILTGVQGTNSTVLEVGTNTTVKVDLAPGLHLFIVQADLAGVRSEPSNELLVESPQPASGFRVVTR